MDTQLIALIHNQINLELFSAYLYFDFANYYAENNLDGFENWFRVQAREETDHALLFTQYLHNNDEKVELQYINKPEHSLCSFEQPLELSYQHEKQVTLQINHIYGVALDKKDYRTIKLLDWFIEEQGEEEKTAGDMIAKMELFGKEAKGLYLLNTEFAARQYTAPSLVL